MGGADPAVRGSSGFGWLSLDEDKCDRTKAQLFDAINDRPGMGARDLLARIPAVGDGIVQFSMTQVRKVPRDPREHDWRPGGLLLAEMLRSRATAAVNDDERGNLIRALLIRVYSSEYVPVKPGTRDFDWPNASL
jgi:hypothetical protein